MNAKQKNLEFVVDEEYDSRNKPPHTKESSSVSRLRIESSMDDRQIKKISKKNADLLEHETEKDLYSNKESLYISYSKSHEIKLVSIGLASGEKIRRWAEKILPNGKVLGQVNTANTLHHKTFKPQKGGLFCERIFGPLRDFECACGQTQKPNESEDGNILRHRQAERKFCPNCDVEYTWSIIRRYQMGYIQLVSPVSHLWYLKANPSYLSLLLDIKRKKLENIIYCSTTMTLENTWKFARNFGMSLNTECSPTALFAAWRRLLTEKQPSEKPVLDLSSDRQGKTEIRKSKTDDLSKTLHRRKGGEISSRFRDEARSQSFDRADVEGKTRANDEEGNFHSKFSISNVGAFPKTRPFSKRFEIRMVSPADGQRKGSTERETPTRDVLDMDSSFFRRLDERDYDWREFALFEAASIKNSIAQTDPRASSEILRRFRIVPLESNQMQRNLPFDKFDDFKIMRGILKSHKKIRRLLKTRSRTERPFTDEAFFDKTNTSLKIFYPFLKTMAFRESDFHKKNFRLILKTIWKKFYTILYRSARSKSSTFLRKVENEVGAKINSVNENRFGELCFMEPGVEDEKIFLRQLGTLNSSKNLDSMTLDFRSQSNDESILIELSFLDDKNSKILNSLIRVIQSCLELQLFDCMRNQRNFNIKWLHTNLRNSLADVRFSLMNFICEEWLKNTKVLVDALVEKLTVFLLMRRIRKKDTLKYTVSNETNFMGIQNDSESKVYCSLKKTFDDEYKTHRVLDSKLYEYTNLEKAENEDDSARIYLNRETRNFDTYKHRFSFAKSEREKNISKLLSLIKKNRINVILKKNEGRIKASLSNLSAFDKMQKILLIRQKKVVSFLLSSYKFFSPFVFSIHTNGEISAFERIDRNSYFSKQLCFSILFTKKERNRLLYMKRLLRFFYEKNKSSFLSFTRFKLQSRNDISNPKEFSKERKVSERRFKNRVYVPHFFSASTRLKQKHLFSNLVKKDKRSKNTANFSQKGLWRKSTSIKTRVFSNVESFSEKGVHTLQIPRYERNSKLSMILEGENYENAISEARECVRPKFPLRADIGIKFKTIKGKLRAAGTNNRIFNNVYCLSHRYCWNSERDWHYFHYYNSTPGEFDDSIIYCYKHRIVSPIFSNDLSTENTIAGAAIIQKLLMELTPKELKKMDKQNRILLYELGKKIRKLKNLAKKGFAEKLEKKQLKQFCEKRDQLIRRTKVVRKLFRKNSNPESMILTALPVLPPDLRPILKMQNQIAASDLNRLYQRVIYRNDRLKKFLKDPAISNSFEMKYAQRLLQEAVDNLIQNGKGGVAPERDSRGRALKSLSEILKGKQGRFRQYLLGKRVDYSGRSVIVVGPKLELHECGLPKEMARELFLPFLIKRILHYKLARTVIGAKTLLKTNKIIAEQLLQEILHGHPILLNRAPTLHRLGIQAFQPRLVEGRAILLHPLVCPAFNADFDGDQMAVHVPLTLEARAEAWKLMFSRNNLISPATGDPIMLPSQDMVLGCYYLTTEITAIRPILGDSSDSRSGENSFFSKKSRENARDVARSRLAFCFSNFAQVMMAYQQKRIDIHMPIWVCWNNNVEISSENSRPLEIRLNLRGYWEEIRLRSFRRFDRNNLNSNQLIRTTAGRVLLNTTLYECIKQK